MRQFSAQEPLCAKPGRAPPRLNADALIEIDHVKFGYDPSRTILNDVSLSFQRGKVTAILGGSGCGKTTLLRLIGGVYAVTQGRVVFDGQVVDARNAEQLYALRRRLGMLFQFGALFTNLSVYENVAFPLREHSDLPESMIHDIVLMKLQAVGLRGAAQLKISEVSGGMARRIALARAVALDPELIMYDEPFAGLDPISMGVTANLIRKLNDTTGATTLMVSHDVQECFAICDYAYLLSSAGKVVAHGKPAELGASEDPEVRQFIRGEPDGPVRFHYPAPPLAQDLGVPA
ncbi:MAG: ABC transporter ATP-binding protein [Burkholderiales bacterium]|nr:ABC transporter ATP-binding protein [Burkholderiales bacterium]MDE2394716.1 ABC transporter ATP-binding protein [Burkholderiales bacterium]MDE2453420.1 ABC transporter ATP-binding protein [Burkholderiales bacterium]